MAVLQQNRRKGKKILELIVRKRDEKCNQKNDRL